MTATRPATTTPHTRRRKVGLALAAAYCAVQVPSVLFPGADTAEGPPMDVLVVDTVLAVVGVAAVVWFWRAGRRLAVQLLAGCMVLLQLTILPALFVDVAGWVKALAAVFLVWMLASLVLVLGRGGRGPVSG